MSAEERGKIGFRARGGRCAEYVGVRRHAQSVTGQQWVTFWALLGRGRAQKKKIAPQRPRVEKKKSECLSGQKKAAAAVDACSAGFLVVTFHSPINWLAIVTHPPDQVGRPRSRPPSWSTMIMMGGARTTALPSMVKIFIAARQGGGLEGPGGRQITAAAPLSSLTIEALESKRFSARLQGQAIYSVILASWPPAGVFSEFSERPECCCPSIPGTHSSSRLL